MLDVAALRRRFPALAITDGDRPVALFDGPGGTQVPDTVIDAVARYYRTSNANHGGPFLTSRRSDALAAEAHRAVADLLGAASPDEVKFGANMTSLTFHVSRSIAAAMSPGDEIVVTILDHEANVGPWKAIAADRGLVVRTLDIHGADCTLAIEQLDELLTERTRLVAVGWASNAVGTINPVAEIVRRAHAAGAWTYVDAVHAAPHLSIDVAAIGTDFLACSTYKFFGPHAGVLYGRGELLDRLPAYKLRPAEDRFETGTGNFEGLAGATAAVEYLADVGVMAGASAAASRRDRLVTAMTAIRAYEMDLYRRLAAGLETIDGLRLYGITDPDRFEERTPTAALRIEGLHPRAIAERLGDERIAVWDGDFYATGLIERLGLLDDGGVVRIGLTHYNTADEVDRLVDALGRIAPEAGRATRGVPVARGAANGVAAPMS
ncbi:MAG TPA: cysteine desulfurase-like protein [Candidatus Limnocylindrales bacterium]|nr:cysteine desulfurase-like protein [Candidatus Limnocylindrales bacterium]